MTSGPDCLARDCCRHQIGYTKWIPRNFPQGCGQLARLYTRFSVMILFSLSESVRCPLWNVSKSLSTNFSNNMFYTQQLHNSNGKNSDILLDRHDFSTKGNLLSIYHHLWHIVYKIRYIAMSHANLCTWMICSIRNNRERHQAVPRQDVFVGCGCDRPRMPVACVLTVECRCV